MNLKRDANTLALAAILVTVVYSSVQITLAKRSFELESLSAIQQNYGQSRIRYVDNLLRHPAFAADSAWTMEMSFSTRTREYLLATELLCSSYLDGILPPRTDSLVKRLLEEDLRFLEAAHDKEEGTIALNDGSGLFWPVHEFEFEYPSIMPCAESVKPTTEPVARQ